MIVWCAYCQTFQGEKAPIDAYALTHGVCASCEARAAIDDEAAVRAIQPIVAFYARLRAQAEASAAIPARALLDEAKSLGIAPIDLLWGMLQPLLYEIGDLWSQGRVTIATEHRFSMNVETVLDAIAETLPAPAPARRGAVDFLLVNAEGDHHVIGVRMVDLFLRMRGRSTFLVVPGLPSREVLALAGELEPKTIGVSIALPEHAVRVREIVDGTSGFLRRPRVIVGGWAVKMGLSLDLPRGAEPIADVHGWLPR
jgi:methanogenic corrinoid protein MtbC1